MKSYTLKEAWNYLDDNFGSIKNVYDAYVVKEDWMKSIDNINLVNDIAEDLLEIERSFGITSLREKQAMLHDKVYILELPVLGYKYSIPQDVENEIKLILRETKKEISALEEEIQQLLNTIKIEHKILHRKN